MREAEQRLRYYAPLMGWKIVPISTLWRGAMFYITYYEDRPLVKYHFDAYENGFLHCTTMHNYESYSVPRQPDFMVAIKKY